MISRAATTEEMCLLHSLILLWRTFRIQPIDAIKKKVCNYEFYLICPSLCFVYVFSGCCCCFCSNFICPCVCVCRVIPRTHNMHMMLLLRRHKCRDYNRANDRSVSVSYPRTTHIYVVRRYAYKILIFFFIIIIIIIVTKRTDNT